MADGKPDVQIAVAPNDNWKTPLNFTTHADYFGRGLVLVTACSLA